MFYAIFFLLLLLLQHDTQADYILGNEQFVLKMASKKGYEMDNGIKQEHAFKVNIK
jgi:hypothetical protein